LEVSGVVPLKITVGRTDVTELTVRGKPFDLSAVAHQGVARFEVQE
jgi:cytoskeleton protein RodZ